MPDLITIELKSVRLFGYHGVHDEEAVLGNEFELQLMASFPANENITTLNDTVDYTAVYNIVTTVFIEREKLLETVVQKIVCRLENAFPQLQTIQLTITKLHPVLAAFTGSVGITYNWQKEASAMQHFSAGR